VFNGMIPSCCSTDTRGNRFALQRYANPLFAQPSPARGVMGQERQTDTNAEPFRRWGGDHLHRGRPTVRARRERHPIHRTRARLADAGFTDAVIQLRGTKVQE